jgi:hypothetical protein
LPSLAYSLPPLLSGYRATRRSPEIQKSGSDGKLVCDASVRTLVALGLRPEVERVPELIEDFSFANFSVELAHMFAATLAVGTPDRMVGTLAIGHQTGFVIDGRKVFCVAGETLYRFCHCLALLQIWAGGARQSLR